LGFTDFYGLRLGCPGGFIGVKVPHEHGRFPGFHCVTDPPPPPPPQPCDQSLCSLCKEKIAECRNNRDSLSIAAIGITIVGAQFAKEPRSAVLCSLAAGFAGYAAVQQNSNCESLGDTCAELCQCSQGGGLN